MCFLLWLINRIYTFMVLRSKHCYEVPLRTSSFTSPAYHSPVRECNIGTCDTSFLEREGTEPSSLSNDVFLAPPRYKSTSPDFACLIPLRFSISHSLQTILAKETATDMDPPTPLGSLGIFPREVRNKNIFIRKWGVDG